LLTNKSAILVLLDDLMDAGSGFCLSTKNYVMTHVVFLFTKKPFRILSTDAWVEYGVGEDSGRAAGAAPYSLNIA
jgi:hypothetical protein